MTSDSTNSLALECAQRRRTLLREQPRSAQRVCLAASHRLLRAQHFDAAGLSAHFRLLGLCTAGRDEGDFRFECESLRTQLDFVLRLLEASRAQGGSLRGVRIELTLFDEELRRRIVESEVLGPLSAAHPESTLCLDPERASGRGYYRDLCFKIFAETDASGEALEVGDGGFVDWTQQLLANQKERLLITGVASERLCGAFAARGSA